MGGVAWINHELGEMVGHEDRAAPVSCGRDTADSTQCHQQNQADGILHSDQECEMKKMPSYPSKERGHLRRSSS